jgi:hypothetical protein
VQPCKIQIGLINRAITAGLISLAAKYPARLKGGRMTDQQILIDAIERAGVVIADHIDPSRISDPDQTIDRLIAVLDTQEVAGAVTRLRRGLG